MNTFQQQYLSVLGTAAGSKFLKAAETTADAASDWRLSKDKGARTDAANEWSDEYENLSRKSARYLSGLELKEIERNKGDTALKAFDELRNINKHQVEEIAGLKDINRHQVEEIAGLKAQYESLQAINNKWAAKRHISNKQMKQFRKDIGGKQ